MHPKCIRELGWVTVLAVAVIIAFFSCVIICHAQEMDYTKAVIHHTATPLDTTVFSIANYHIGERGWDAIGYHYVITPDGQIWGQGYREFMGMRKLSKKGAHTVGRNHFIGIALVGHDLFTMSQLEALNGLLRVLEIVEIQPHHQDCPGPGINLQMIQDTLN